MRHTVRAIIVKDKKVLLVTGHGAKFYWTPGGGVEKGERVVETLKREIKEELNAEVVKYEPYYSYEFEDQKVENFLVEIKDDFSVGEEVTGYAWYSTTSSIETSNGFNLMVKPKLLKDGLIE